MAIKPGVSSKGQITPSETKPKAETEGSVGKDTLGTFLEARFDDNGDLPPFLDKVFADIQHDSVSEVREPFYKASGKSRFPDYKPTFSKLAALRPEKEGPGWDEMMADGLRRRANGFIRTWNEMTGEEQSLYHTMQSLNDNGVTDFMSHYALPMVGFGVLVAGTPLAIASSALLFGGFTASYLNKEDRLDANMHDSIVTDLLGKEGLLPDDEEELLSMGNVEFMGRMFAAEVINAYTAKFGLSVGSGALKAFRHGVGRGQKGAVEFLGKAKQQKAVLDSELKFIEAEAVAVQRAPLFPDGVENVTTRTSNEVMEAGLAEIKAAGSLMDLDNNTAVIRALRQAKLLHYESGVASLAKNNATKIDAFAKEHMSVSGLGEAKTVSKVDHAALAGNALVTLRRSSSAETKRKALKIYTNAAATETLAIKDTVKSKGGTLRKEQLKAEKGVDLGERYSKGLEATGAKTRSFIEGHGILMDEYANAMMKGNGALAHETLTAIKMSWGLQEKFGRHMGGNLQQYSALKRIEGSLTTFQRKMEKAAMKGDLKGVEKWRGKHAKMVEDMLAGKDDPMTNYSAMLSSFKVGNALGKDSILNVVAGNTAAYAQELFQMSFFRLQNPLPSLFIGLRRAIGESPRILNVKRVLMESGGSGNREHYRSIRHWNPTKKWEKMVKSVSNLHVQAMKEGDVIGTGLGSHLVEVKTLRKMIRKFQGEGAPLETVKSKIEAAIKSDVPTSDMEFFKSQTGVYNDRMLMRGKFSEAERVKGPYASMGYWIDDIVRDNMEHPITGAIMGHVGLFSKAYANVIHNVAKNTVAGASLQGITRRQAYGTMTAMAAYQGLLKDKIVMPNVGRRSDFYKFGGKEGIMMGDMLVPFHRLGPIGEIIRTTAYAHHMLQYVTSDDLDDEKMEKTAKGLSDVFRFLIVDSWLGNVTKDLYGLLVGQTPMDAATLNKFLKTYMPADALADRIAGYSRGRGIPNEGQLGLKNLADVITDVQGVPVVSAFGTPYHEGDVDDGLSSALTDLAGDVLFVSNPSGRQPQPKNNQVVKYLIDAGMLDHGSEIYIKRGSGTVAVSLNQLPSYFNVKLRSAPRYFNLFKGVSGKLSYTGMHEFRHLMSMDEGVFKDTMERYKGYYDSSTVHESDQELKVKEMATRSLEYVEKAAMKTMRPLIRNYYGSSNAKMIDVIHRLATAPIDSQSRLVRDRYRFMTSAYFKNMQAQGVLKKLKLSDREGQQLALQLARNYTIKEFYTTMSGLFENVMMWHPSLDEQRRASLLGGERL